MFESIVVPDSQLSFVHSPALFSVLLFASLFSTFSVEFIFVLVRSEKLIVLGIAKNENEYIHTS